MSISAYDGRIKFEEYAGKWMEAAQIAPKTREGYISLAFIRQNHTPLSSADKNCCFAGII